MSGKIVQEIHVAVIAGNRTRRYEYKLYHNARSKKPWALWLNDNQFREFTDRAMADAWLAFMTQPYNTGYERQEKIFEQSYE